MAANGLRLRRSLTLTSSILNHQRHFTSAIQPVTSRSTIQQNPNPSLFDVNQPKQKHTISSLSFQFQFISSRSISSRARYNNDEMDGDQISPDAILFEGCDYNHWLITMDFPKDPKPSPEEMVEAYVQTAAKVLGSVEEAKKKIYACSTTTYNGFQVEVSEEVSEQFKGLPGVVFVLPDSYIDPVNKEYGGDKYINGTIIPRPPPVQYGRQGGRYNDRNRDYNRPPRSPMEQGGNYQGDRRGPMPSYQGRQTDFPQRDQGNFAIANSEPRGFRGEGSNSNFTPPPVGDYNQGGGGGYRQGGGGQFGQGRGGGYGQGAGGQYGQTGSGNYGQGVGGGNYGQGAGGGNYGQGAGGGNYGQGAGGGSYGQGAGGGNYGQGVASGNYGQGAGGGNYGQGAGGGNYGQSAGGQYGQGTGGQYGQGRGGSYGGGGYGAGSNQTSSQYGENPKFSPRSNVGGQQQGNYEVTEETEAFKER